MAVHLMDIYIGKSGLILGPYYPDEIQKRLDEDQLDGTELAWHEGLDEWVNVKELLEDEAPAPEAEETSVEPEPAEKPKPLDEETQEQINKIEELIVDGHPDTAWQLIQSLNNPRIYEGLLENCPVNENGCISVPQYFVRNLDLFIKLLASLPESARVKQGLRQLTKLDLSDNQISDVRPLKDLTQLTQLRLSDNRISDVGALAALRQLRVLDLEANKITDVAPLAGLTKLEWLCLGEDRELELHKANRHSNQITNLQPLHGLENLRQLTLYRNLNLSQSEVDMLAAALPQCSIGYRSLSEQREEDDEWREMITKWASYEGPGSGPGSGRD